MRETEIAGWLVPHASGAPMRTLRLAAVALGVGLVMTVGAARAQDENADDDQTFEEKIIDGLMRGVGATNMENRGIDYRERSPLVVPPKLDLPPPATAAAGVTPPNWPKDPDLARRKAQIAARKKEVKDPEKNARSLMPDELNVGRTAAPVRTDNTPIQPGTSVSPMLSPSQLGYDGGLLGMFKGNTAESAPFKGEPTRDSLTEPPVGYQTPSPNFAYGTGPKESLNKTFNVMTGKEQ